MDWSKFTMDLFDNSLAVLGAEAIGLSDMVVKTDDSDLIRWGKMGLIWSVLDEAILMFRQGTSHFQNGDYYFFVDNTAFNVATWALLEKTGLGARVSNEVEGLLPLSQPMAQAISSGVIKVSAKMMQDLIDSNWSNTNLVYLTHLSHLWRQ